MPIGPCARGEGRPLNGEEDRAEVLAALECVDYITIFAEPRVTGVIEALRLRQFM